VKKKPRLSSPENASRNSSQEHLNAFGDSFVPPKLGFAKATALLSAKVARTPNINDDPDNPFANQLPKFTKASYVPSFGFTSAASIANDALSLEPSSSPDAPPIPDYESWLKPRSDVPAADFKATAFASAASMAPPSSGIVSDRSRTTFAPSAAALAKAQARLNEIWGEDTVDTENLNPSTKTKDHLVGPFEQPTFHRPALQVLDNGPQTPDTPTPAGSLRSFMSDKPQMVDQLRAKQKPFKSPLLRHTPATSSVSSPLKPTSVFLSAASMVSQSPASSTTPFTPLKPALPSSKLQTPFRAPASTPRTTQALFVTPFKPGMRPGEPGWTTLQQSIRKGGSQIAALNPVGPLQTHSNPSRQPIAKHYKSFFDIRTLLLSCHIDKT
jgi:breast cancer 2 susceptibility protein